MQTMDSSFLNCIERVITSDTALSQAVNHEEMKKTYIKEVMNDI